MYCLPTEQRCRLPGQTVFRGSMAGLCTPLPTLRPYPRGHRRTARGRCGSLLLHRGGLSPPTPCRFIRTRLLSPVSSTVSSAFPRKPWVGCRICPANDDFSQDSFRGRRYFVMFRPPSLLAPQIVPTAATTTAGQPGLLRPGLSCFVTSTRTLVG